MAFTCQEHSKHKYFAIVQTALQSKKELQIIVTVK